MPAPSLEKVVSLCKRRGFIFPNSSVYGGLGSTWDYGPLGVELKNNVKRLWWQAVVYEREDMEGLDSAILMNRLVWKYSGHEATFSDPLVDCRSCKARSRADHLQNESCPKCGSKDLTQPRQFNLMFKTYLGPVESEENQAYLRPETAQGIFMNFLHVLNSSRRKLPFGIAQIGKAFRNEITPGNFTFRTREFEQMEIEYFCKPPLYLQPGEKDDVALHQEWVESRYQFYLRYGIAKERLQKRMQSKEELAHYAKATVDIEYLFPGSLGFSEIEGIANRQDYDLSAHSRGVTEEEQLRLKLLSNTESTEQLVYFDEQAVDVHSGKKGAHYTPYVIEPSAGADRVALAFLCEAYQEEWVTTPSVQEIDNVSKAVETLVKSLQKRLKELSYKQNSEEKNAKIYQEAMERLEQIMKNFPEGILELVEIYEQSQLESIEASKKLKFLVDGLIEKHARTVLKFHPQVAPVKVAVFPLKRNEPNLVQLAKHIKKMLSPWMRTVYDDTASIGKLYRRQDEIGTPYCITVDYQSIDDQTVTLRNRDTMMQERVPIATIKEYLIDSLR